MLSTIQTTAGTLRLIQLASGPAILPFADRFTRFPAPALKPSSSTSPNALMNTAPMTYAIRVDSHLDDHWSAWLGDLDITRHDDGTTTLTVSNADQAQLHGVLASLLDIGAVITELRTAGASSRLGALTPPSGTPRKRCVAGRVARGG